ncbi:XRE family transcriptional regulator [Aliarcobacter vitoriensis]|uniref:Acyl carrier protein n=1 Tax=Aliarcobacter vitoriensis TaxID=2011099 RepID=A0A366MR69_9BACT|nr:XRE family transcriptional regulator [Aliarcobacter vitoriensis]RBQ27989.1 acyl carrier protein [Aliarcobacter vitoriensis]
MDRKEFNNLLKIANLSKKDFCDIIGLNYATVNTWGSSNINIPLWVKSWLENYLKAKDFDNVLEILKPYTKK